MTSFRTRTMAAACAAAIAITGLSAAAATADEDGSIADLIGESASADARPGRPSTPQAHKDEIEDLARRQAQQGERSGPNASSSDYANGAVSRTARVADQSSSASPENPQQRISRVDVTQDLVGQRLRATVTFRQVPTNAESLVAVYVGEWSGSSCQARAAIGGTALATSTTGLFIPQGTGTFAVSRSRSGATLSLTSAVVPRFRTAPYDCAFAAVLDPNDGGAQIQGFYAEDLVTNYKPKLSILGGEPVQGARQGRWVNMRLEIYNGARSQATGVKIVPRGKGLRFSPRSRSLGTIGERSSRYGVTFKVRVAKGTKARKLTYTVTASGGVRATKSFTIGVAPKPRKYKSLAGRYFWGFASTTLSDYQGWDTEVMWFLNKRWVHIGEAKGGATPKCRKTTASCKRYSYNRKTGVAKIGKKKVKVTTYGYRYQAPGSRSRYYEPVTFPRKGARLGTSLVNRDWHGYCMLTCTTTTTFLTMDKKSRFVLSGYSIGSWPGLGSSWASIPPDKRGTYRIIGKGRIQLKYADGTVRRHRIGILHNALNRPSPTTGVVLGATNYYYED